MLLFFLCFKQGTTTLAAAAAAASDERKRTEFGALVIQLGAENREVQDLLDESFFNGLKDMLESTTDKVALLAFRTYCKREMDRTQASDG